MTASDPTRAVIGAVIGRWYRAGLLRFNSHDDGSDDMLLRDEIWRAVGLDRLRSPRNSLGKLALPKGPMERAVEAAWEEATSPVGDPADGIEMHDLSILADAICDHLAVFGSPAVAPEPECFCESEFPATCGPECECWHHSEEGEW